MRSNRHQPCLMASPSQRASLATSSRPLGLGTVVMSAFFLLSAPAGGQTRNPQQAALDDFVAARMLGTKCPSWQIDLVEARTRFAQLNLRPADWQEGGRHAGFFDERLSYYGSLLSRMSETRACAAAEEAFGPDGRVRKGWMKQQ
ncbi:hypothetical protein BB934_43160 (plasmid) [Microvirga ossetica]|uniref:Uncharacterized protein n=2 Tax=Microvirga ossetica TaxID=1882682 RepID=A0A1B2EYG1_9HYPH|nr:hypothetical protein BB934_43160 [Microvirga ossetica]